MTSTHVTRHFRDLSDAEIADIEQANLLVDLGWRGATTWDDLLKSSRVLIISEAGAGKTHECRVQHQKLWDAGEAAFLIELAELAKAEWSSFRSIDESGRPAQWKAAQSETAIFFLDSIDELKLTQGSFKTALTRLANELAGQMMRVRVIVTSRPVAFDRQVFEQAFPLPSAPDAADENTFADTMLGKHGGKSNEAAVPLARTVGLMSLSDEKFLALPRPNSCPTRQHSLPRSTRGPCGISPTGRRTSLSWLQCGTSTIDLGHIASRLMPIS